MERLDQNGAESPVFYAEQTLLALDNFPPGPRRVSDVPAFVSAYGAVKAACARANVELGVLDPGLGEAVLAGARSVAALEHLTQFRIPLVQGGGGTSTNMNVNEVIAAVAAADGALAVHPNDHVNASQSTNDTYPTAMALAVIELAAPASAALAGLREALLRQAGAGESVRRLGRTCLRDAVTLTVAETHRAQAAMVERARLALEASVARLRSVPLGGTVLGTGAGAPPRFAATALRFLAEETGQELHAPDDLFAAMAHLDGYGAVAESVAQAAVTMARVAADLRLLSAGPVGGPAEVVLPPLQRGSSIMPGKVNPVIPELVMQLSYRVRGSAHTVQLAVAAGELELNVMGPVVLDALVTSLADIRDAADYFAAKCIDGLRWDRRAIDHAATGALDELVDLANARGYAAASLVAETRQAAGQHGDTAVRGDRTTQ
ncbi:lyase family protein [Jiangella alba]|uniref:Aspartate ammonia-lyase n=1 Tax=Jiangella alba TaxID=561176 RepID=A0A1H5PYF0_9ACTN|nr:lyase family protein [Jiangella alba]SEF18893.1 aspartate ammonia-lyase [Jiangella alba]